MGVLDQETITLRNSAGTSVALTGPIYVTAHQGLGMVTPIRSRQKGPYQHGYTLTSASLGDRAITLKLRVADDDDAAVAADVRTLIQLLNNIWSPIYLDVTTADGLTRRLDVYYTDGLSLPHDADEAYGNLPDVVQFTADNPVAYNPAGTGVAFGLSGGGTGMPIPMIIPFTLGASVLDEYRTITYLGTWAAYPIIRITGPIDDCVITNVTTGEKLDFTDFNLGAGEWLEIDCRYGYKSITEDDGDNHLGDLTTDSDLATFHIAPADGAAGGINDFHVTGTSVTGATAVMMRYNGQYLSAL